MLLITWWKLTVDLITLCQWRWPLGGDHEIGAFPRAACNDYVSPVCFSFPWRIVLARMGCWTTNGLLDGWVTLDSLASLSVSFRKFGRFSTLGRGIVIPPGDGLRVGTRDNDESRNGHLFATFMSSVSEFCDQSKFRFCWAVEIWDSKHKQVVCGPENHIHRRKAIGRCCDFICIRTTILVLVWCSVVPNH